MSVTFMTVNVTAEFAGHVTKDGVKELLAQNSGRLLTNALRAGMVPGCMMRYQFRPRFDWRRNVYQYDLGLWWDDRHQSPENDYQMLADTKLDVVLDERLMLENSPPAIAPGLKALVD